MYMEILLDLGIYFKDKFAVPTPDLQKQELQEQGLAIRGLTQTLIAKYDIS